MSIRVGIRSMGRALGLPVGAWPMDVMEYVFTEGTGVPLYDVMYDTVHAVPATPVAAAQSAFALLTASNDQRKLVRMSDGTLYTIYLKKLAGKYQIYVIRSEDDGATWTDDTRISTYPGMNLQDQQPPAIAVDSSDNLHAVWFGKATGFTINHQVWYAFYDGSWHTPVRLSIYVGMNLYIQWYPCIAVDFNDDLHVVWYGYATGFSTGNQIWYVKGVSPYEVANWTAPIPISTYPGMSTRHQNRPSIAVDSDDNLHVVWDGFATGFTTRYQIWHAKYDGSWITPVRISTAADMSANHQMASCIAVDSDDNLHVVWFGAATDFATYQIRYATAVPPHGAGDWVTPIRISTALNMGTNNQQSSSIAVDNNNYLHVLWHGKATGYTTHDVVWYAVYVASWATPVCIQPTGRNMYPNLRWSRWPR